MRKDMAADFASLHALAMPKRVINLCLDQAHKGAIIQDS
jgi:hypothetical protein